MSSTEPRIPLRPLHIRPGASYRCFGDGLCCHDIHGLGPLSRKEAIAIRRVDRLGARYDDDFEDTMLRTAADGGCHFLMSDMRCRVHAELGPEHKPSGCRQFPLGVTATPMGTRLTTEHRCPCRTLGDRPAITEEAVMPSIVDRFGDPDPDRYVRTVRLERGKRPVDFARYLEVEAPLLSRLGAGEHPREVLDAAPFPKLRSSRWDREALEYIEGRDGTRFGQALAWFGDTILQLTRGERPREPSRPWADAFDRAEARSPTPETATAVLADWVSDVLWSLKWADALCLAVARAELATRVAIADSIIARLVAQGLREDRAAAEAVMIVEVVGESEFWGETVRKIA